MCRKKCWMHAEEDDDWAPLSPEQLTLRPGEFEPGPPPAPSPQVVAPLPKRAPQPPDPRAEQLLRDLQDRIARAPKSDSIVASVDRHEQRRIRRGQMQQRATGLGDAMLRCDDVPEPPAEVEYEAGRHGRDEREDSEWFQRLPEQERARLHDAWADRRAQLTSTRATQRRFQNRRMMTAWLCFAGVFLLGTHMFWPATLGGAVLCGLAWRVLGASRWSDVGVGLLSFAVANIVVMLACSRMNMGITWDATLLVVFTWIASFDAEMKRSGGFDAIERPGDRD